MPDPGNKFQSLVYLTQDHYVPLIAYGPTRNLGVEAGQLLFIATLLLVTRTLALRRGELPNWLRSRVALGIETLAAFWTSERIAAVWL